MPKGLAACKSWAYGRFGAVAAVGRGRNRLVWNLSPVLSLWTFPIYTPPETPMCRWLLSISLLALSLGALASPCTAPEYHQLDFWLGDWDTVDMSDHPDGKGPSIARAHIEPILGGCALHEL